MAKKLPPDVPRKKRGGPVPPANKEWVDFICPACVATTKRIVGYPVRCWRCQRYWN